MKSLIQKRNGLAFKIAGIASIIMIVLVIMFAVFLYKAAKNASEQTIADFSMSTAQNIAKHIDKENYAKFLSAKKENKTYWNLRRQLNDFRKKTGSLYVYTIEVTGDKKIIYMVDGQPKGSDVESPIGEVNTTNTVKQLQPALNGGTSTTGIVHDPKYGDFLSVFVPIKDENGKVLGILGVDTDAKKVGAITDKVVFNNLPIFLMFVILLTILAVGFLIFYIYKTLKPLNMITSTAEEIASGNIAEAGEKLNDIKANGNDEIRQLLKSFRHMAYSLKEIIQKIMLTSEQVASSSEELSANANQTADANREIETAIDEVSSGSVTQREAAKESALAMEDVSESVQQVARSANHVAEACISTLEEAKQGQEAVQQVLTQMEMISHSSNEITKFIGRLENHSRKIVQILDVITEIANNTNLLSLNAGIEAARAGEYGKGFGVVAGEIRKLAEQSRNSVDQVAKLVHVIQEDTSESVRVVAMGNQEVQTGLGVARGAEEAFRSILGSIEQVAEQIQEVSVASEQMSASSQQVSASLQDMSAIAEKAADNSEQVIAATKEQLTSMEGISSFSQKLNDISKELQELIQRFQV